jgi:hypothetical protein
MYYDPGARIQGQIGASLNAIRQCVAVSDIAGITAQLRLLIAICSPKLTKDDLQKLILPKLEAGRDRDGSKKQKVYEGSMIVLADLLKILSDRGLYSYQEPEPGDASDLALGAESL